MELLLFRSDYGELFSRLESQNDELGDREKAEELASANPEFKPMVDAFYRALDRARDEVRDAREKEIDRLWGDLNTEAAAQTRPARASQS